MWSMSHLANRASPLGFLPNSLRDTRRSSRPLQLRLLYAKPPVLLGSFLASGFLRYLRVWQTKLLLLNSRFQSFHKQSRQKYQSCANVSLDEIDLPSRRVELSMWVDFMNRRWGNYVVHWDVVFFLGEQLVGKKFTLK